MREEILEFYRQVSMYTNAGAYHEYFKSLPDDMEKLAHLIRSNIIHRVELMNAYLGKEEKKDIKEEYPWYRYRCEDDILLTAPAMMAELFRQDERGLVLNREIHDKIVVTCRYMSVLCASILKAKGYSCRVRSGFAPYFYENVSCDHWVVEYYNQTEKRWVVLDVDGEYHDDPTKKMIFASSAWNMVRHGKCDVNEFVHGSDTRGLAMLARSLFFDFHSLMNDEISYLFLPTYIDTDEEFLRLSNDELKELDHLAELLEEPDKNFDELRYLFRNDKKLRTINTPLVGDRNHLEVEEV